MDLYDFQGKNYRKQQKEKDERALSDILGIDVGNSRETKGKRADLVRSLFSSDERLLMTSKILFRFTYRWVVRNLRRKF